MKSIVSNEKQLFAVQKIRRWRRYGLVAFTIFIVLPIPIGIALSDSQLEKYSEALAEIMLFSFSGLLILFFSTFFVRFLLTIRLRRTGVSMQGLVVNVHTFGEFVGRSPVFRITGKLESGELTQAEFTSYYPPRVGSTMWFLVDPKNHARSVKMPGKDVTSDY